MSAALPEPVVVGREDELAVVAGFVDAAGEGPAALVLEGEAGIGKTTIVEAVLKRPLPAGVRMLAARLSSSDADLPFAALGDLLEGVGHEALSALAAPQREAIEVALARAPGVVNEHSLARGMLELLRGSGADGPVLVVIDDVQWLDRPTAAVLGFALRRLGRAPVRVLVAVRSANGAAAEFPLGLSDWDDARRLVVGGMSPTDLGRLLRDRLGARLPRPRVEALHEHSAGNPMFALEVARRGSPELAAEMTLPTAVGEGLRGLDDGARRALSYAAAAAQPSPTLLLAAGVEREDLRAALESGVLELAGDRLRLAHPLVGSVAYELLLPDERREIHVRLAAVSAHPVERGYHVARATVGPDLSAAEVLDRAAAEASALGDHVGAAALHLRAAELSPQPSGDAASERELRASAELLLAGDVDAAISLARGLVERAPAGVLRARARKLLVSGGCGAGMSIEEGLVELAAALVDAGSDDSVRAELYVEMSELACGQCRLEEAVSHARTARELAERAGESATAVAALATLGFAESMLGQGVPESARIALARWDGTIGVNNSPRMELACCCMHATRFEEAAELFEQELAAAEEFGVEPVEVVARGHLAEVQLRAGRWADALANARLALEHARQAADPQVIAATSCVAGMAEALLGHHDQARSLAAAGLTGAEETGDFWWTIGGRAVLGIVALAEDDSAAAVRALELAWALMLDRGLGDLSIYPVAQVLGEAFLVSSHGDAVGEIVTTLRACPVGKQPWCVAMSSRLAALLAATQGDHDAARTEMGAALEAHADLPEPFEHARTLQLQGRIERSARNWGAARKALIDALERFDQLGAARWSEKAAADLARLPGRRPAAQSGLTVREREIAELAAAGLTNKEIAARLFLSVRAVEANLSRVYGKLGVRSRTGLASLIR